MEHIRVRASDPITSFKSAGPIESTAKKHHSIILECLSKHGPLGKDGIANHTGLLGHQIGKRLTELHREGLIAETGKTVKSNTGREEREWKLIPIQQTLI